LGWSCRRAAKAAQKLPTNDEKILDDAFLREAYIIRDHAIPAALRVNTDQTQVVYQQGAESTWNERGQKQVATTGQEEKRAFTLVPSVAADGTLLPTQAIFAGKTAASCPSPSAPGYAELLERGCIFAPSGNSSYWSTHETMHQLVVDIIAPYFDSAKAALNLPATQASIWKIDCWSVHRSQDFRAWMALHHPTIIVVFVPGGCT
ncbi:hypothetical protein C8F01DRAFT_963922, partial [Mycena amicta]